VDEDSALFSAVARGVHQAGPTVEFLATLTMAFVGGPGMKALDAGAVATLGMLGGCQKPRRLIHNLSTLM
jgi:hypothetical protein